MNDKTRTIRVVKMDEKTVKEYETASHSALTLYNKNLRRIIKKSEEFYQIEPIICLTVPQTEILEYSSSMGHVNGFLGLIIDNKQEKYFQNEEIISFINDSRFNKYRKLETSKEEYAFMDYRFKLFNEKKDQLLKVYPAHNQTSFYIERYYPKKESDAKKLNAKLRKENIDSGIYFEVDENAIKEKYKKYITTFDKHMDSSYSVMSSHLYLLPYVDTHHMPRATKKMYLTLIKHGEAVGTKVRDNGAYDILPYNNENIKELKKYHYNLSYIIPPVIIENYLHSNPDRQIETLLLEADKVPGGYQVHYYTVKNFDIYKRK